MKEKLISVDISPCPLVKIRVIDADNDDDLTIKSKKKYPFALCNDVEITVQTDRSTFNFFINKGYVWNGADIPKCLFIFGQSKDNNYLIASMVHDFLLEKREDIFKNKLLNSLTASEYRRLTSLIFRQILKDQKTNVIKANIMSWCVDVFQMTVQRKQWECLK